MYLCLCVIASFDPVAQFEMGDQAFTGMLDGYGRLQRFELNGARHRVCFESRMMDTLFYNASIEAQKIVPTLLFEPSVPDNHYSGTQNLMGPHDNVCTLTTRLSVFNYRSYLFIFYLVISFF